jgi:hypothetical protein
LEQVELSILDILLFLLFDILFENNWSVWPCLVFSMVNLQTLGNAVVKVVIPTDRYCFPAFFLCPCLCWEQPCIMYLSRVSLKWIDGPIW